MATIQKRGNSYRITVSCGRDINDKQILRTMTWKPPQKMTPKKAEKEARHQAELFEERVRQGVVATGSIRFSEFSERWMKEYAEQQLRAQTIAGYRHFLERTNAAIGHLRLDRIQPHHLLAFYRNLAESGIRKDIKYHAKRDLEKLLTVYEYNKSSLSRAAGVSLHTVRAAVRGDNITRDSADAICTVLDVPVDSLFEPEADRPLADRTIQHYHKMISTILSTAVEWQLITQNPCDRVKPPRVSHREAAYLDDEQTSRLLRLIELEPLPYRAAVVTLLMTGMRRGELLGLRWEDIDFEGQIFSVYRTIQYLPGRGIYTDETKTTGSRRTFRVAPQVVDLLRELRAFQNGEQCRLGDQWHETGFVFTRENGEVMQPNTLTGWFRNFIARTDLPPIHLHSLRHTNASLLIAAGINLQTVAKRLGHSDATTTARIYSHAIDRADAAAADALGDVFASEKPR